MVLAAQRGEPLGIGRSDRGARGLRVGLEEALQSGRGVFDCVHVGEEGFEFAVIEG